MKHTLKFTCIISLLLVIFGAANKAEAKKIHNKIYKYKISVPATTLQMQDTLGMAEALYYDTSKEVVLIISARQSTYRSVKEYMDCTNHELEHQLRQSFGDSTLTIISCNRSEYYPEQSTVVHFTVSDMQDSFNTYTIYFIHYNNEDLQISFNYNRQTEQKNMAYIDNVMHTFKLL